MVIIPNFKNVILDYKTSGDFNKYLKNIKIREHSWYTMKKDKKNKELRKSKKKVDVYSWSAKFFFEKAPKTGYLEVIYR